MINRLKELLGEPPEPSGGDDYFEIECRFAEFVVSARTALEIERCLERRPPPRWIAFRDLTGARHRVLAAHVTRISESTMAQRAADRAMRRARRLEDKSDHPWDDDYY